MIKDLPYVNRIRRIHAGMKSRCSNSTMPNYIYYGAKGISVCEEWMQSFINFYEWAMLNGYNDNLTLDRIDPNGNYEPNNCRWVTVKQQDNNRTDNIKIEFMGEVKTIPEWAELLNLKQYVIRNRLKRGWSVEKTLKTGVRKYGN